MDIRRQQRQVQQLRDPRTGQPEPTGHIGPIVDGAAVAGLLDFVRYAAICSRRVSKSLLLSKVPPWPTWYSHLASFRMSATAAREREMATCLGRHLVPDCPPGCEGGGHM